MAMPMAMHSYRQQRVEGRGERRKMPLGVVVDNRANVAAQKACDVVKPPKTQPVSVPALKLGKRAVMQTPPEFDLPPKGSEELANVEHKISQREKQLTLGRQTSGYRNYVKAVPLEERDPTNPTHVVTPRASWAISKRKFDLYIRQWRRDLHTWDSESDEEGTLSEGSDGITQEQSFISSEGGVPTGLAMADLPPLVPMPDETDECDETPPPPSLIEHNPYDSDYSTPLTTPLTMRPMPQLEVPRCLPTDHQESDVKEETEHVLFALVAWA